MTSSAEVRDNVKSILINVLGKADHELPLAEDTSILGAIPEFDSMAVVSVLTAIEEQFGIYIEDDDVDATVFETFGALVGFVEQQVARL